MFNLELDWDIPAKIKAKNTKHILRVRIRPQSGGPGLPLRIAIALDTSQSMGGENLQRAQEACRAVVAQLRDRDRLSLAGFSTSVTPLLQSLPGGAAALQPANTAISQLTAGGVTLTGLALDWIVNALPPEAGVARVGILITDGHATTPQGFILDDTGVLIDRSQQLANLGIILNTVGLGNANNFNTAFLTDLSDKGRGSFIFADTPASLQPQLQKRLTECQAMATENTVIQLIPSNGVTIKGFCRYRPEYLPLEETAKNQLTIGAIAANTPTDLLIELEIPLGGFDEPTGNKDVISVELTAKGMTNPVRAKATINYTNNHREAQKENKEIKNDHCCWLINLKSNELSRTDDANLQKELLEQARFHAEKSGKTDIVNQIDQQIDDLEKSGKLDANRTTKLLRDSRDLGGKE
ncbi:VWA domain-containing protein [Microcoleus sp.]|uniref:vWA domain-containing protein n=1 Tax=Microcoleus sp. TaxID=44472 RepID=UPI00352501BA